MLYQNFIPLQLKDAAQLALKKMPSAEQEALSQVSYLIFIWVMLIIKLIIFFDIDSVIKQC